MSKLKKFIVVCLFSFLIAGMANAFWLSDLFNKEETNKNFGASVFTVRQGGTGAQTFDAGECLVGNGTGAVTSQACGGGGGYAEFTQVGDSQQAVSTTPFIFPDGIRATPVNATTSNVDTQTVYTELLLNSANNGDAQISWNEAGTKKWYLRNDGDDGDKLKLFLGDNTQVLVCNNTGKCAFTSTENYSPWATLEVNGTLWGTNASNTLKGLRVDGNLDAPGSITNYYGSACLATQAIYDIADDGTFSCMTPSGGGGGGIGWAWNNENSLYTTTTTDDVLIGALTTTTQAKLEVNGDGAFLSALANNKLLWDSNYGASNDGSLVLDFSDSPKRAWNAVMPGIILDATGTSTVPGIFLNFEHDSNAYRMDMGWGGAGGANFELYSVSNPDRPGQFRIVYGGAANTGHVEYKFYDGANWKVNSGLSAAGRWVFGLQDSWFPGDDSSTLSEPDFPVEIYNEGTTKVAYIDKTGAYHSSTTADFQGAGTNLFAGNIDVSGNATITKSLTVESIKSCDTIDTDANGLFKCGSDDVGAAGDWATSSSDFWETEQWRWVTSSADYWETVQAARGGGAWSTSSNDYWETVQWRWASSSADYWISNSSTIVTEADFPTLWDNEAYASTTIVTEADFAGLWDAEAYASTTIMTEADFAGLWDAEAYASSTIMTEADMNTSALLAAILGDEDGSGDCGANLFCIGGHTHSGYLPITDFSASTTLTFGQGFKSLGTVTTTKIVVGNTNYPTIDLADGDFWGKRATTTSMQSGTYCIGTTCSSAFDGTTACATNAICTGGHNHDVNTLAWANDWKMAYSDNTGVQELAIGGANTYLMSNGEAAPTWSASDGSGACAANAVCIGGHTHDGYLFQPGSFQSLWANTLAPSSTSAGIFVYASSSFNSTLRVTGDVKMVANATSSHFGATEICIANDCKAAWPTGSGETGAAGAWKTIWANALTPTSSSAGVWVLASSTFNSTVRINDAATTSKLVIGNSTYPTINLADGDLWAKNASSTAMQAGTFCIGTVCSSAYDASGDCGANSICTGGHTHDGYLFQPGAWQALWTNTLAPSSTAAGFYSYASSTVKTSFRADGTLTAVGNALFSGVNTSTGRFVIGSTNPTNNYGGLWVGGDAWINGGATTTHNLYSNGYVSSTVGFFSLGNLNIQGKATTSSMVLGLTNYPTGSGAIDGGLFAKSATTTGNMSMNVASSSNGFISLGGFNVQGTSTSTATTTIGGGMKCYKQQGSSTTSCRFL